MFDLEKNIGEWRQRMARTSAFSSVQLDELESHLRDKFDDLHGTLPSEEALNVAVRALGNVDTLAEEFMKDRDLAPRDRIAFVTFYSLLLIVPIASLVFLWAYMQGGPRFINNLDNVVSLVSTFSTFAYLLFLSLIGVYGVLSNTGRHTNDVAFSNTLYRTTVLTIAVSLFLYIVSWASTSSLIDGNSNIFSGRTISFWLSLLVFPVVLSVSLLVLIRLKLSNLGMARFNILLGIFFFLSMLLDQVLRGEALLIELIPIAIVSLFAAVLVKSIKVRGIPEYQ